MLDLLIAQIEKTKNENSAQKSLNDQYSKFLKDFAKYTEKIENVKESGKSDEKYGQKYKI